MSNLIQVVLFLSGVLLAIGFYKPVLRAFRRFEARNAERRRQELQSAMDQYAHYRQTIQLVEEQVEPVSAITVSDERTGQAVTRYVFLGTTYATRKDAEAARFAAVIAKAREFYIDLDRIFLSRRRRWSTAVPTLTDPTKSYTRDPHGR